MKSGAPGILAVFVLGLLALAAAWLCAGGGLGTATRLREAGVALATRSSEHEEPAHVTPSPADPAAPGPAISPTVAVLSGRVLAADDGVPLSGVRLEVAGSEVFATTDAAGAFRLEGIPTGPRALSVLPPEHLPLEVELDLLAGAESSRDLYVGAGALLEGRVLFEEKPVAVATVAFEDGGKRSVTGEDGRYALPGMPPGEYLVEVTAPGFHRQEAWAAVEPGKPSTQVDIVLSAAWTLRGIVRSEGRPVAGARVAASWDELVAEPFEGAVSGEDGAFTLRGVDAPENGRVHACKEGTGVGFSGPRVLFDEAAHDAVVVEIPAPLPLDVKVVAEGDAGVEGAEIEAVAEEIAGVSADSWREPGSWERIRSVSGRTDSSGRARLSLPPGEWRLFARRGGTTSHPSTMRVPRQEEGEVELRLYPWADIAGRVADSEGLPVPGAWVSAWTSGSGASTSVTADAEGRFTLAGVIRADHRLQADQAGFVTRTIEGVKPGPTPVEIVLDRESRVGGTVLLADGVTPCRSFTVRLYLEAKADGTPWEGRLWPFVEEAVSDAEGRFEIRGVEAGRIAVEAVSGDRLSPRVRDVRTEPGRDPPEVRLVLRRGAVLRGTVTGEGERPAPGSVVSLLSAAAGVQGEDSEGVLVRETIAGPDGTYELRVLPAGRFVLCAEAEGHFRAERAVEVAEGADVALDLALPRGSPFTAGAVDGGGSPLPDAWIGFLDEDGEQGEVKVLGWGTFACFQISTIDEDFRIAPGSYRVQVTAEGYASAEFRFEAREGVPVTVRAVLKPE